MIQKVVHFGPKKGLPNFLEGTTSPEVVATTTNHIKNREEVSSTVFMSKFSDIKKKLANFFFKNFRPGNDPVGISHQRMDLSQKMDRPNFEPVKASIEVVATTTNRIKNREEVSSTVFMYKFSDIKKKLPNFFFKNF